MGKWELALQELDQVLDWYPEISWIIFKKGICFAALNRGYEAKECFMKAKESANKKLFLGIPTYYTMANMAISQLGLGDQEIEAGLSMLQKAGKRCANKSAFQGYSRDLVWLKESNIITRLTFERAQQVIEY